MKEYHELRCPNDEFRKIQALPSLRMKWVRDLGSVKVIRGDIADPIFLEFYAHLRQAENIFLLEDIERQYSEAELAEAELLALWISAVFEPTGEECGTRYNEFRACKYCKAGRVKETPLRLDIRKVPKAVDMAQTISGDEWILSNNLRDILTRQFIRGAHFEPVESYQQTPPHRSSWSQLIVDASVEFAPDNLFGTDSFGKEDPTKYVCPLGHTKGLNLLSAPHIKRTSWDGSDIVVSSEYVGHHGGLIVPRRLLFVSQKVFRLLRDNDIKRFKVEVARLV